jgi:hypothetical protein
LGLLGRWVNALPAAVLAALVLLGFRRTFEAAVAAFLLVCSFAILITSSRLGTVSFKA